MGEPSILIFQDGNSNLASFIHPPVAPCIYTMQCSCSITVYEARPRHTTTHERAANEARPRLCCHATTQHWDRLPQTPLGPQLSGHKSDNAMQGRSAGDLVHKEGQLLSSVQVLNATLARASARYAGDSGSWCAVCMTADGRYLKEGAPCCTMAHRCNENCLLMCLAGRQWLSQSNPCP